MRFAATALSVVLVAACSGASSGGPVKSTQPSARPDTLVGQARQLAYRDHHRGYTEYLSLLRGRDRRCRADSPMAVVAIVVQDYGALISYRGQGLSRLSLLRSLAAGIAPKGPLASCDNVGHALVSELRDTAGSRAKLNQLAIGGVSELTRSFSPPVSDSLALASIRHQFPGGRLRTIYSLAAANCSETIYLNSALSRRMGGSTGGIMVELTSGHGITSHYDKALVSRARLTIGEGRHGGQSCV